MSWMGSSGDNADGCMLCRRLSPTSIRVVRICPHFNYHEHFTLVVWFGGVTARTFDSAYDQKIVSSTPGLVAIKSLLLQDG